MLHDVIEAAMIVPALTDEQRKRKRAAQNDALGMDTPHGIHALEPNAQRLRHSPDATYPERSPPLGDLAGHPDPSFVLPVHTDELGRLPLHGFTMSSMVTNAGVPNAIPGPSTEPAPPSLESSWFGAEAGPSGLSTMAAPTGAEGAQGSPSANMAGGLDAAGLASMFGVGVGGGLGRAGAELRGYHGL